MIYTAIAGEKGPGGAAKGRIPNNPFLKKGLRRAARVSRATVLIGVSGQNYAATRGRLVRSDIYGYKRTLAASFYASRDKSQNVDI